MVAGIPGVAHQDAVRALRKARFQIIRQGKHIVMKGGNRWVVVPRHNPLKAFTLGIIGRDARLTAEEFRALL